MVLVGLKPVTGCSMDKGGRRFFQLCIALCGQATMGLSGEPLEMVSSGHSVFVGLHNPNFMGRGGLDMEMAIDFIPLPRLEIIVGSGIIRESQCPRRSRMFSHSEGIGQPIGDHRQMEHHICGRNLTYL
jgi:hypothetical protein